MEVGEATRQYQAQLEAARTAWNSDHVDLEDCEEADAQVAEAREAMQQAWITREMQRMQLP